MAVNFAIRILKRIPYALTSMFRRREEYYISPSLKLIHRIPKAIPFSFYEDIGLLFSKLNSLYQAANLDDFQPIEIGSIPMHGLDKFLYNFRLYDRAFRCSIQVAWKISPVNGDTAFLAVNKSGWWLLRQGHDAFQVPSEPPTVSMPMSRSCCVGANGKFYHGEYIGNSERRAVRIYEFCQDTLKFSEVFAFQPGEIRHIHALLRDQYIESRIWIFCGDLDSECNIYFSDDHFESVNLFFNDGQNSRVVDAFFLEGSLVVGMDSPWEKSFVLNIPRNDPNEYKKLQSLPAPSYYVMQNSSGAFYIGLTAEPGGAVELLNAYIYGSYDGKGESWQKLLSVGSDNVPQHGILYMPGGVLPANFIVFSSRAVRRDEGTMLILRDETDRS